MDITFHVFRSPGAMSILTNDSGQMPLGQMYRACLKGASLSSILIEAQDGACEMIVQLDCQSKQPVSHVNVVYLPFIHLGAP